MRSVSLDSAVDKILYHSPSDYVDFQLPEFLTDQERQLLDIYNILSANDYQNLWHWKFNPRIDINGNNLLFEIPRIDVFKFAQTVRYTYASLFLEALSLSWVEKAKHYLGKFLQDLGRILQPTEKAELISLHDAQRVLDRALCRVKYEYSTEWRKKSEGWKSTRDIAPFGYGKSKDLEEAEKYYE